MQESCLKISEQSTLCNEELFQGHFIVEFIFSVTQILRESVATRNRYRSIDIDAKSSRRKKR